jgi:hypothetical protein
MAVKKPAAKKPAAKKPVAAPVLVFDEGYWWIVKGSTRVNVGRSERYAQTLLKSQTWG